MNKKVISILILAIVLSSGCLKELKLTETKKAPVPYYYLVEQLTSLRVSVTIFCSGDGVLKVIPNGDIVNWFAVPKEYDEKYINMLDVLGGSENDTIYRFTKNLEPNKEENFGIIFCRDYGDIGSLSNRLTLLSVPEEKIFHAEVDLSNLLYVYLDGWNEKSDANSTGDNP